MYSYMRIDYFYEDFRILWVLIALWFILNKCNDNCYYYGDDDDDGGADNESFFHADISWFTDSRYKWDFYFIQKIIEFNFQKYIFAQSLYTAVL